MQFKKREINAEEIACYKRQLEIAEPYTYEEMTPAILILNV